MLKATYASIIAAAALVAVPVAAQTQGYNAGTSMSTETRGTTGTGDQYMRNQENYTASPEEAYFEATGERIHNDSRSSGTEQHYRSTHRSGVGQDQQDHATLDEARQTTGTGDQYMRNQENYTESPEEAYFDSTGRSIRNDPHYGGSHERADMERRYDAHQIARASGDFDDAYWASSSLTNQSVEGFVGNPFVWDSSRYMPNPDVK